MRTIIAGSREGVILQHVEDAIEKSEFEITTVISGTARGADTFGEFWAEANGIPVERFPADWELYGKRAGFRRNVQMAENADALIAIWDGESKGTQHMINIATQKGLKVFVHCIGSA